MFSLSSPVNADFTDLLQYKICNTHGPAFDGDKLRELPNPIPCRYEIIPNPDSIPLTVLNHPLGISQEIDLAAYDPPDLTLSPAAGGDPVFVLRFGSSFATLTGK